MGARHLLSSCGLRYGLWAQRQQHYLQIRMLRAHLQVVQGAPDGGRTCGTHCGFCAAVWAHFVHAALLHCEASTAVQNVQVVSVGGPDLCVVALNTVIHGHLGLKSKCYLLMYLSSLVRF